MEDIKLTSDAYAKLVNWCTELDQRIQKLEELNTVDGMITAGAPRYVKDWIAKKNTALKEGEVNE